MHPTISLLALLSIVNVALSLSLPARRQECEAPLCSPGEQREDSTGVDCQVNCISFANQAIIGNPNSLTGSLSSVISGLLAFAAINGLDKHEQQLQNKRSDDPTSHFVQGTMDATGVKYMVNATWDDMFENHVGFFGRVNPKVNVTQSSGHVIKLTHPKWTATINGTEATISLPEGLAKRGDTLTGAKVNFHNALVFGVPQTRDYTDEERQSLGEQIANDYLTQTQRGRVMCACLRSGLDNGFVASLSVHGQENGNGKFQSGRCDCDTGN